MSQPIVIRTTQFNGTPSVVLVYHASPASQCPRWRDHRNGVTCAYCGLTFPAYTRKHGKF